MTVPEVPCRENTMDTVINTGDKPHIVLERYLETYFQGSNCNKHLTAESTKRPIGLPTQANGDDASRHSQMNQRSSARLFTN